jgi:hypothetical protein
MSFLYRRKNLRRLCSELFNTVVRCVTEWKIGLLGISDVTRLLLNPSNKDNSAKRSSNFDQFFVETIP